MRWMVFRYVAVAALVCGRRPWA